jgi:cytochrome o ubiquinol oxidase operon protein cyoD
MSGEHASGAGSGSLGTYTAGFVLSLVLTVVPFVLVMAGASARPAIVVALVVAAVVQIVVHMVFFLHMNASSDQHWNRVALAYAAVTLAIVVGGSIWIMYHLNLNMMLR